MLFPEVTRCAKEKETEKQEKKQKGKRERREEEGNLPGQGEKERERERDGGEREREREGEREREREKNKKGMREWEHMCCHVLRPDQTRRILAAQARRTNPQKEKTRRDDFFVTLGPTRKVRFESFFRNFSFSGFRAFRLACHITKRMKSRDWSTKVPLSRL